MSGGLVTVATFTTAPEAAIVAGKLEQQGITTHIADEAITTWAWQLSNAVGGVKVQVAREDEQRAREVLAVATRQEATAVDGSAWTCTHCDAAVDADMSVCWSCGTSRDGVVDTSFVHADHFDESTRSVVPIEQGGPIPPVLAFAMVLFPPLLIGYAVITFWRRYGASEEVTDPKPSSDATDDESDGQDEIDEDAPQYAKANAIIRRAWRGAVFGVCFIPLVLNIYSVWQMCKFAALRDEETLPTHRRTLRWAAAINIFVFSTLLAHPDRF